MALVDNRDTIERACPLADIYNVLAVSSDEFYIGQMVMINLSTGKLTPVSSGSATTKMVCGRCEERYTSPSANTRLVKFKSGIFRWTNAGSFTVADIGKVCYASDDSIVGATNTNPIAGRIVDVASDGVDVLTMYPLPELAPIGPTGV